MVLTLSELIDNLEFIDEGMTVVCNDSDLRIEFNFCSKEAHDSFKCYVQYKEEIYNCLVELENIKEEAARLLNGIQEKEGLKC